MIELNVYILVGAALASNFVGALLRWVLFKKNRYYKDVMFDNIYLNIYYGGVFFAILVVICYGLIDIPN